jgi:hypothetical protein
MDIFTALVHHPVLNRTGGTMTSAVTNLDVHDFARISRTYDCAGTFIVTPVTEQLRLVETIRGHWAPAGLPGGQSTNPSRSEAFSRLSAVPSIDAAVSTITTTTGHTPLVIATSARPEHRLPDHIPLSWDDARARFAEPGGAALIIFGTSWGLTREALAQAQAMLPPVNAAPARAGYNHLPVRAACAIILDRVCGDR